tara:strand:+ start:5291 stop:5986 length:696 start_codon:yes stop_codon:yes gene_type:complete
MKQVAKISGIAYILIFLSGFYANFAVLEGLIDSNSPFVTTTNFINSHAQFGNGLLGFVIMLFFDVVLISSLYYLTKPTNRKLSYVASFFRILHALFFGVALLKLLHVYDLTNNNSNSIKLQQLVTELLLNFDTLWTVGLLFFGVHLIILGYLALKSTYIPKALGILLVLAAIGYLIDGIAKLMMSNYMDYKDIFEIVVVVPSVVGEFSFTVWLLLKGFMKRSFKKNRIKAV